MPRPKTKSELREASQGNYDKLLQFIESLTPEQLNTEFPQEFMNRNVRDVMAHLHHWHMMFMNWYWVGMNGDKPHIPAEGYTWKTVPELNRWIRDKYSDTPLQDILKEFQHSHKRVTDIINDHPEDELFEKKRFKWTGTTSLGAYLIGATSSHYDWAFKLIKKCLKQSKAL